jgi:hypothetical protein
MNTCERETNETLDRCWDAIFAELNDKEEETNMIRIEIDDNEGTAHALRAAADKSVTVQRAYKIKYDEMAERVNELVAAGKCSDGERAEFAALPKPLVEDVGDYFERALIEGARSVLYGSSPNCVMCMNGRDPMYEYKRGEGLRLVVSLPIGAEVCAIQTSVEDGNKWIVQNFCFGAMNFLNAACCGGECVPLSTFQHVTRADLLSVFDGMKTKVDVLVNVNLICKRDGATFDGIRLLLHCEEMYCAIQMRIEPVDHACDHAEVVPVLYEEVSPRQSFGGYQGPRSAGLVIPTQPTFRCVRCKKLVAKAPDYEERFQHLEQALGLPWLAGADADAEARLARLEFALGSIRAPKRGSAYPRPVQASRW